MKDDSPADPRRWLCSGVGGLFEWCGVSLSPSGLPTAAKAAWQLLVCTQVDDCLFYWTHRLLHHRLICPSSHPPLPRPPLPRLLPSTPARPHRHVAPLDDAGAAGCVQTNTSTSSTTSSVIRLRSRPSSPTRSRTSSATPSPQSQGRCCSAPTSRCGWPPPFCTACHVRHSGGRRGGRCGAAPDMPGCADGSVCCCATQVVWGYFAMKLWQSIDGGLHLPCTPLPVDRQEGLCDFDPVDTQRDEHAHMG